MKFSNVKVGEVLSSTMYLTVAKKLPDGVAVKDSYGREFEVRGKTLIEETMNSAMQFDATTKVGKIEMAEMLLSAGDSAFTVVFDKADGTERTLIGKLISTENHLGRSNVHDLQVTSGTPTRQVDHRTIKSLILRGTKYVAK